MDGSFRAATDLHLDLSPRDRRLEGSSVEPDQRARPDTIKGHDARAAGADCDELDEDGEVGRLRHRVRAETRNPACALRHLITAPSLIRKYPVVGGEPSQVYGAGRSGRPAWSGVVGVRRKTLRATLRARTLRAGEQGGVPEFSGGDAIPAQGTQVYLE